MEKWLNSPDRSYKFRTEEDGTKIYKLPDAIGQGVDVELSRTRGIVSVLLVDSATSDPIGPSAEIIASVLIKIVARF